MASPPFSCWSVVGARPQPIWRRVFHVRSSREPHRLGKHSGPFLWMKTRPRSGITAEFSYNQMNPGWRRPKYAH